MFSTSSTFPSSSFGPSSYSAPLSHFQLRFSARNLANKDFLSLSDPFLVCHSLSPPQPPVRIGRTETVKDDLNPFWTTTMTFADTPVTRATMLLLDIFDRDSTSDDRLTKHDFLGRAVVRVRDVLEAEGQCMTLKLGVAEAVWGGSTCSIGSSEDEGGELERATSGAKGVKGDVTVWVDTVQRRGREMRWRVSSALLRERCGLKRKVGQFWEIQRERMVGDQLNWVTVYRSKDGTNISRENYVVFDEVALTEQTLSNGQPNCRLRVAFYKRNCRIQHELISYCETTLNDIFNFQEERRTIPMEGRFVDDTGLGNVIITKQRHYQQHHVEAIITLRADHFLNDRFTSSLNDAPKHVRKLRQLPSFITLH